MDTPLVSLALPIKNGLPGLRRTLAALQRQTYRRFEVVVQDGGSTDGSLDCVRESGLPEVHIASVPDSGIAQAYNRAFARCRGPLVAPIACDEYLEDHALDAFVRWHRARPGAAFCYGGARLWKSDSAIHSIARAGTYDFVKFLRFEYVPPAGAGCYNKEVVGADFYCDEGLTSVPDFDLFLRLGLRFGPSHIVEHDEIVVNSMRNAASFICRPENYDQVLQDISYTLNRLLVQQGNSRLNQHLYRTSMSGAYSLYAAHVLEFDGETPQFYRYVIEAAKLEPGSGKVAGLVARTRGLTIDADTGQALLKRDVQPETLPAAAGVLDDAVDLRTTRTTRDWRDAETRSDGAAVRVITGGAPWSYAAGLPLDGGQPGNPWRWVDILVEVQAGQVGIGVFAADGALKCERLLLPGRHRLTFPFSPPDDVLLLVRNGSLEQRSVVDLIEARILGMEPPDR